MPIPALDLKANPPKPTLFDKDAHQVANFLDESARADRGGREKNKSTQIRRFYDELVGWQERIGDDEAKFKQYEAFIRMMNAKAAYAKGRNLVTDDFVAWFGDCLRQVDSAQTLNYFRLHFEAMLGFLKAIRG